MFSCTGSCTLERRVLPWIALLVAIALTAPALLPKQTDAQGQRLVLAFYYTWFDENTWTGSKVPDFPAQTYASRDSGAMDRQIGQAQGAGIDAFVVSWYGPWGGANNQTEGNFAAMLDVAAARGFKLALDVEATSPFVGGTGSMVEMLRHALGVHANHPAYLRVDGKPVLFFWREQRWSPAAWQSIRDQVDPNHDSIWIAEGIDMSYQSVFDGHHLYSVTWNPPSDVGYTASKFSRWVNEARDRYGSYRYWVATAMPGYNDTRTGRGNAFVKDREGGAYYARTWEAAIASNPDWVIVNSWNEWPEGTYIEPSQAYGDQYLGLTAEWAGRFKSGAPIAYTPPAAPAPAAAPDAPTPAAAPPSAPRPTAPPIPTPDYAAVQVQAEVLNMRSRPSAGASLVGQADGGSVMRATGKLADESWWQVCCVAGRPAWVSGDWVQPLGPATALGELPVVAPLLTTLPAALIDRLE